MACDNNLCKRSHGWLRPLGCTTATAISTAESWRRLRSLGGLRTTLHQGRLDLPRQPVQRRPDAGCTPADLRHARVTTTVATSGDGCGNSLRCATTCPRTDGSARTTYARDRPRFARRSLQPTHWPVHAVPSAMVAATRWLVARTARLLALAGCAAEHVCVGGSTCSLSLACVEWGQLLRVNREWLRRDARLQQRPAQARLGVPKRPVQGWAQLWLPCSHLHHAKGTVRGTIGDGLALGSTVGPRATKSGWTARTACEGTDRGLHPPGLPTANGDQYCGIVAMGRQLADCGSDLQQVWLDLPDNLCRQDRALAARR